MADSKRQDIVELIVTALGAINGTGAYVTSIGTTVTDWGLNFQEDELPAVSVCDISETVVDDGQGDGYGDVYDLMKLTVQIRVQFKTATRPAECRKAIADILTALRAKQRWNNGTTNLALQTDYKSAEFLMDEEKFSIAAAAVNIEIFYKTEIFNGYQ